MARPEFLLFCGSVWLFESVINYAGIVRGAIDNLCWATETYTNAQLCSMAPTLGVMSSANRQFSGYALMGFDAFLWCMHSVIGLHCIDMHVQSTNFAVVARCPYRLGKCKARSNTHTALAASAVCQLVVGSKPGCMLYFRAPQILGDQDGFVDQHHPHYQLLSSLSAS